MPVFNMIISDKPILLSFKFTIFRVNNNKRKIYVAAKLIGGQNDHITNLYIPNAMNINGKFNQE